MAMREFLLYPDIPVDDSELELQLHSQPMDYAQTGLPDVNNTNIASTNNSNSSNSGSSISTTRIGYIPVQSTSYGPTAGAVNGYLDGPPKLHIISVSDKEFYVTRIRGTPRFNPAVKARVAKKRSSVLKQRRKEATFSENEISSYSDDGNSSEKQAVLDRSQENCGLIYPKSSPRKVPAPRILSRFNPRHWAERPALKSQVSTTIHHNNGVSVEDGAQPGLVAEQEQLTLYSSLSPYG